jgi:hypothetical protein
MPCFSSSSAITAAPPRIAVLSGTAVNRNHVHTNFSPFDSASLRPVSVDESIISDIARTSTVFHVFSSKRSAIRMIICKILINQKSAPEEAIECRFKCFNRSRSKK